MRFLRRLLNREPPPEATCPRCGVPAPAGTIECAACGWDLRDAYHDPLVTAQPDRGGSPTA
jgi:hypothetical protein